MKAIIDSTRFGSITVDGNKFDHDIIISLNGTVTKRKKKLSKEVYGTSHIVSLREAEFIYEEGAEQIIVGSGQYGALKLSEEAAGFFKDKNCIVELHPSPYAGEKWNTLQEKNCLGLFHVTC